MTKESTEKLEYACRILDIDIEDIDRITKEEIDKLVAYAREFEEARNRFSRDTN